MHQQSEDLVRLLDQIGPETRTADHTYQLRCRVPFKFDAPMAPVRPTQRAQLPDEDDPPGELITGIASSTSVDFYGTHMTLDALRSMEAQFRRGVDYFPRHHSFMSSVEWDEVIGRSVDARIRRARVKNPVEPDDADQFVLEVDVMLDTDEPLANKLLQRIRAGSAPGQSIGGWFTEISVSYDDEGEIKNIGIVDVELDHLAAVRSPANPDAATVYQSLRNKLHALHEQGAAVTPAGADPEPEPSEDPQPEQVPEPEPEQELVDPAEEVTESDNPDDLPPAAETDLVPDSAIPVPIPGVQQANADSPVDPAHVMITSLADSATHQPDASRSAGDSTKRGSEINMDASELRQLFGEVIDERLRPIADKVAALESRGTETASEADRLREEVRARRAEAAEAEARLAALEGRETTPAPAQRTTIHRVENQAQSLTPEDMREIADRQRADYHGLDVREVAPNAARAVARSLGELPLTPDLVGHLDGTRALAQLSKADGSSRALASLVVDDEPEIDNVHKLKYRSNGALRELLVDILDAGLRDRIITAPAHRIGGWS